MFASQDEMRSFATVVYGNITVSYITIAYYSDSGRPGNLHAEHRWALIIQV